MQTADTQSALELLQFLVQLPVIDDDKLTKAVKKFPKQNGQQLKKSELLSVYRSEAATDIRQADGSGKVLYVLRKRPIRTASGVAPITVLTKPFPCPGKCIFCPSDIRMPKSYLSDEPGAQRAERNWFDPYLQVARRLRAMKNTGHNITKAELIILGGTWSFYSEQYQIWFIKECFRALNEFGDEAVSVHSRLDQYDEIKQTKVTESAPAFTNHPLENEALTQDHKISGMNLDETYNQVVSQLYTGPEKKLKLDTWQTASWEELAAEQLLNQSASIRCVGLVVETRPDYIDETEVIRIRRLGCTKVQIGVQSLNDSVLTRNHRGHDVAATRRAFKLLRQAGFKIHAHWMPNLYGSTVELDKADFDKLFADPDFKPDELKIYPCSLIESAELMQYYQEGKWRPYTSDQLLDVISHAMTHTPPYCRLTRVIRDIPGTDIVVGNKRTNFRQIVEQDIADKGLVVQDIRSREIRHGSFDPQTLKLSQIEYKTSIGQEIFLQYTAVETQTQTEKLVAFLRLSLPREASYIPELRDSSVIREVHVYGEVVGIGDAGNNKAQHGGLGKKLIAQAEKLSQEVGFKHIAVISAVGTRGYYEKLGFRQGELFQSKPFYD